MKRTSIFTIILAFGFGASIFAANTVTFYKKSAVASFYAEKFHGRKTANGEIFNMNEMTAAHKTLPFNTKVRVTNLDNGKSVVVRINDRGPFIAGREIDISKAAATELDMLTSGTARVSLEIVQMPESLASKKLAPLESTTEETPVIEESSSEMQRWDIQLGAFNSRLNAEVFAKKAQKAGLQNLAYQTTENVTRVVVRNLSTEEVADQLELLENKGYTEYLVKERKN